MSDIRMQGKVYVGPYKGYHGSAEYDFETGAFHGEVTETRDVITFVGKNPDELITAFRESIDDYLEFCESRGEKPDKAFSGKFVLRVAPELHHDLYVGASSAGKSLNQFVADLLASSMTDKSAASDKKRAKA